MNTTPIKRGVRFFHKRVFDPATGKSMEYEITRVADGVVYYKPVGSRKAKDFTLIEDFHKRVAP